MCNRQYTLYTLIFAVLIAPAVRAERDDLERERKYPDYVLKDFSHKSSQERAQELERDGERAAEKHRQEHKLDGVKKIAGIGFVVGLLYGIWSWFTSGKSSEEKTQSSYAEASADKQSESAEPTSKAASQDSTSTESQTSSGETPQN